MSYYQKKEIPPLFHEADKWIKSALKDEEHLYENGHSPNGLERIHLRFLYSRIKAIVHSQKAKEDENFYEFDFEDVLSAVDDEYNDWIRQTKKAKGVGAVELNEIHRDNNPGFEIGQYRTKHHPDFDKKEGGGVGRGSDYNNARKNAEIRVETTAGDTYHQKEKKVATTQQGSPKRGIPDGELVGRTEIDEMKAQTITYAEKGAAYRKEQQKEIDDLKVLVGDWENDFKNGTSKTALGKIKYAYNEHCKLRGKFDKFADFQTKTNDAISTILNKVSELESSNRSVERENEALKKQVESLKEDIRDLRKTGGSMFRLSTYVKECDTELSKRIHQLEIKTNSDDAAALIRQAQIQEMSPLQMLSELKKDEKKELAGISEEYTEGTAEFDNAVAACIAKHKKLKEDMIAYQKGFQLYDDGDEEYGRNEVENPAKVEEDKPAATKIPHDDIVKMAEEKRGSREVVDTVNGAEKKVSPQVTDDAGLTL